MLHIWRITTGSKRPSLYEKTASNMISYRELKGYIMSRFIEEDNRQQTSLFPERLDEYLGEDYPVRFIDAFDGTSTAGQDVWRCCT